MKPKLSVIIPVYNTEQFLPRCLDSILSQTLREIEVICVDDGSTDSSGRILDHYAERDHRVRVIHQKNSKQGAARNAGINIAQGEYVGMVDSDDYLPENYFERLYHDAIEVSADIAICGILKQKKLAHRTILAFEQRQIVERAEKKLRICGCPPHFHSVNKIYRREMLDRLSLRFAEGVQYEDVMFVMRALVESGRLVTVPNLYYNYVLNPNSTVKSYQTAEKQHQKYLAHREMVAYVKERGIIIPKRYETITLRHYSIFGICLWKIKERGEWLSYRLLDLFPVWFSKRKA